MKTAIVHDYLNQYGGAERVLEVLHDMYPDAPIFTSIFLPEKFPARFREWDVRPSFMQRLPFLDRHFKKYLPLYPRAVESHDLSGFDLVLSSSSAFAKGARPAPGACHVCYCYTPMRFVWDSAAYLEKERIPWYQRAALPAVLSRMKAWDEGTAGRVHSYAAISRHIQSRIRAAYGRGSEVIYPPVDVSGFQVSRATDDYFMIVSRLNAYKRLELAVEAFNGLGFPLLIVGQGPHEKVLRAMARKNVEFAGWLSQADLAGRLSRCRALVFPGEEDFGLAPVEAMASGRPVIAYGAGGALETVEEGATGLFFREPTSASLAEAVGRFERMDFDPVRLRARAAEFDVSVFRRRFSEFVERSSRRFFSDGENHRITRP